ncbi:MAG: hypothetical protein MUE56_02370 [Ignavibacteria bacterium]|jgi:hypothetical protein|nr:hypothetical protein [Ignavibacteria bacterium]
MKTYLKIFLVIVSFIAFSCSKDEPANPEDNQYVYVCTSNSAKTYHTDRNCVRLKTCKEDILEVTRKKARENERIICNDCSRRDKKENNDSVK